MSCNLCKMRKTYHNLGYVKSLGEFEVFKSGGANGEYKQYVGLYVCGPDDFGDSTYLQLRHDDIHGNVFKNKKIKIKYCPFCGSSLD